MFDLNVAVTYKDARVSTYELSLDTLCEFEEITGQGAPVAFNETNIALRHLVMLGWLAAKEAGEVVKPIKEWRKSVTKVEFVSPENPTHAAE